MQNLKSYFVIQRIKKAIIRFSFVEFGQLVYLRSKSNNRFNTTPQPSFNKQFNLLIEDLNHNHDKGYTNYIACVSEQQAKRFHDIFDDVEQDVHYQTIVFLYIKVL